MNVDKRTVQKTVSVNIRPASYEWEDTGEVRQVEHTDPKTGQSFVEEVPLRRRIFMPATYEDQIIDVTEYVVEDGADTHVFADEVSANVFVVNKIREAQAQGKA